MDQRPQVRLTIDGKEIQAREGMTILEAARANGIHIPTLCHHPALSNWGGCRICVVEVDRAPRLVASCVMPVRDGMEVVTNNERILESRRTILEFLFAERNHYCMFCAQSGDCELQSLAYELGMDHLTVPQSCKEFPVDAADPYMVLDHNRCILCGRCVRACRELAGNHVLNYQNRGARTLICKDLNELTADSSCDSSGVCMQVCPTGAIYHRLRTHEAVKGKEGPVRTIRSSCPVCGMLCLMEIKVRNEVVQRIDGILDPRTPDRGQLCRRGRFEVLEDPGPRLLDPMIRGSDGRMSPLGWEEALDRLADELSKPKGQDILGLVSGGCSCEEMFLLNQVLTEAFSSKAVCLEGEFIKVLSEAWEEVSRTFLGLRECSWRSIPNSDFILFVGGSPEKSHPLLASLARRASMEKGASLAVIGPESLKGPRKPIWVDVSGQGVIAATKAFLSLSLRGAAREPISRWAKMMAEVQGRGEEMLLSLNPQAREALELMAEKFISSRSPVIVVGQDMPLSSQKEAFTIPIYLALLKGLIPPSSLRLMVLKPKGNVQAALRLGLWMNHGGLGNNQPEVFLVLEDGFNYHSGLELPDGRFVAVITSYLKGPLAQKADLLIPRPTWMEQGGTFLSLEGAEWSSVVPATEPRNGVRPVWETLLALGKRLGVKGLPEDYPSLKVAVLGALNLAGEGL